MGGKVQNMEKVIYSLFLLISLVVSALIGFVCHVVTYAWAPEWAVFCGALGGGMGMFCIILLTACLAIKYDV